MHKMNVGDRVYFKYFDEDDICAYGNCLNVFYDFKEPECLIHFDDGKIHLCTIEDFEIVDKDRKGKVNKLKQEVKNSKDKKSRHK